MYHTPLSSDENKASLDENEELFVPLTSASSSQISGGYWHSRQSHFSSPSRSYHYGNDLPASSHQLAAQRLNQALFA